jgi:copper chaperone CopZ
MQTSRTDDSGGHLHPTAADMATIKLRVKGLRHEHEDALVQALRRVPGVLFAVVNHQSESAEIDADDDITDIDAVREALRVLGYDAVLCG